MGHCFSNKPPICQACLLLLLTLHHHQTVLYSQMYLRRHRQLVRHLNRMGYTQLQALMKASQGKWPAGVLVSSILLLLLTKISCLLDQQAQLHKNLGIRPKKKGEKWNLSLHNYGHTEPHLLLYAIIITYAGIGLKVAEGVFQDVFVEFEL